MAFLHVDRGDNEGQIIHVNQDKFVLGRSPDCDFIISKKEAVSRWHAQVLHAKGRYFIEDLKSRNKTFLNDQELAPLTRVPLNHADAIRICGFRATFFESGGDPTDDSSVFEAMLSSKSDHSLATQPAAKLAELLDITAKLSKTLQLDAQLPEVAAGLLRLFPQADRCFLILAEAGTGNLQPKVVRTRGAIDESTARFSHTVVHQCLESAQAILMREEDKKALSTESMIGAHMRSVMCVPLCSSEGPPLGVIQLDTQDAAKRFTEDDLRLLWGVAYQASIAMENARYHELRLVQARIKNELELARQVQLAFLPRSLPELAGYEFYAYYEAALQVGGDYYDFIPLGERRLAVTVGDVAGKGMPAALLMARLSSEARSCLLSEREPTAAVGKLNSQLFPITGPMDRFITLVAAVLDPAAHTVTLVNAGHPAPLLYRQNERAFAKAISADDAGPILGIDGQCSYHSHVFPLNPGDYLVIYSDGVTDAQSVAGRSFRMKGIQSVLEKDAPKTPGVLGERIVKAVQRHALGGDQYDDITLLCFGRPATN